MATYNLSSFGARARKVGRIVDDNFDEGHRAVALAAVAAVVPATPEDTGKARSNWFLSIGSPATGVRETYGTGAAAIGGALAAARAVLASHVKGASIWLSNNVPYIDRLNTGWSAQAPAGFIEASINAAKAAVREIRLLKGV
jgi:hypothetical protein